MNFLYRVLLTIFYTILLLYTVINFFSDSFFIWFTKNTYNFSEILNLSIFLISLFFSIFTIIFIVKNKEMGKDKKTIWIIASVLFPIALIYFVWKYGNKTN